MATTDVLVRIKRFGNQWASCGITVRPPQHLLGQRTMKYLCPKLVPGQVIRVPADHTLLNQACVEIVRRLEADEFERPWVFVTAEAAKMANPTKSRLGADKIAEGLALAQGAVANAPKKRDEERRKREAELAAAEQQREDDEYRLPAPARPQHSSVAEDEDDGYQPNPRNSLSRGDEEDIRQRDAEVNQLDEPVASRRGRGERRTRR